MHKWSDSPIVTFSRDGQDIELGRSGLDDVIHMNGSTGLGLAPVQLSKSDRLGGDGSILRGVRYGDREVFIPLFVQQPSTGDLHLWRRTLDRLLAPVSGDPEASLVDVTIEDPTTGSKRTARGVYTGGLEGEFGSDYHGDWQTLGVTIECHDPWWLGPERLRTLRVAPGTKPFLSRDRFERLNLATNPRFETLDGQFGAGAITGSSSASIEVSSEWASVGDTSLKVTPGSSSNAAAWLMPSSAGATYRGAALAGKTVTVGIDIHLETAQAGSQGSYPRAIGIGWVDASGASAVPPEGWSESAPNTAGTHRIVHSVAIPEGAQGIHLLARNGNDQTPVYFDALTIEEGVTDGDYFDGDSEGGAWRGTPGASESGIGTLGTPFFPIVLAPSNVVGEWSIDVAGDAVVWPSWEITGPGRDLLIESGSDRIFIAGEFPSTPTLIQTRPRRITPIERWEDTSLDSVLFPLKPGTNRIRVTMVGADANTTVRLVYRERYREGI